MMLALISHLAVRVPACHPPLVSCAIMAKVCVRVWVCARAHANVACACACAFMFVYNCFCRELSYAQAHLLLQVRCTDALHTLQMCVRAPCLLPHIVCAMYCRMHAGSPAAVEESPQQAALGMLQDIAANISFECDSRQVRESPSPCFWFCHSSPCEQHTASAARRLQPFQVTCPVTQRVRVTWWAPALDRPACLKATL